MRCGLVRFLALRGEARLTRSTSIKVTLDIISDKRNQRRTTVDHAADRRPVAFAKGGDAEKMAEAVVAHPPAGLTATEMSGASSAFMPTM